MSDLYTASSAGDLGSVRAALARGEDSNIRGENTMTPLMTAAYHGHTSIVSVLLSQPGVDLGTRDIWGFTALHWACDSGRDEIVRMLVNRLGEEGCNVRGVGNMTPIMMAVYRNHVSTVRLMCEQEGVQLEGAEEMAR